MKNLFTGEKSKKMLDTLNHGDYAAQLNTKFRIVETDESAEMKLDEPLEVELIDVSELKSGGGQEMFALNFLRRSDIIMPQKLYELEHETLGRGMIFLVPVGQNENGIRYEAVFNRLQKD